jgi:hypothetical protein
MEELLVSSLAQTDALAKLLIKKGAYHASGVYAEDFRRTGDVSKTSESDTTVTDHRPLLLGASKNSQKEVQCHMELFQENRKPGG